MAEAPWTVRRLLRWSTEWLLERGVEAPRLDSELLLAKALEVPRLALFLDPDRPLVALELAAFKALIRRRGQREPTAYILGSRGFWTLELMVGPGVLIPRPESERLVEVVIARWPERETPLRLLDVGVGSGALLLALLSAYPQATGVGIDCAPEALATTLANGQSLGLLDRMTLLAGNWLAPVAEDAAGFDLVIANPPYIAAAEWSALAPEVREFEPRVALWGGEDGLDGHRAFWSQARPRIRPQGMAVAEIGAGQGEAVAALAREAGFTEVTIATDYARLPRVVWGISSA